MARAFNKMSKDSAGPKGGGKRGTCPPEATTRHTLPPEKKFFFFLSYDPKCVMQEKKVPVRVAHSNPILTRLQSVKMVGH